MSDGAYHAKLSPSGAARYMRCPGSPILEAEYPRTSSKYADEGTAAHILATMCLQGTVDCDDFLNEEIRVGERRFLVTDDMVRYVQMFVDDVRQRAEGKMLLVEVDVPIGHLTGETGATGRSDVIIVDTVNRHLIVDDLKYGMGVEVDAEDNEQLQKYALGALEECALLGDFDKVTMVIHQPRIREEPKVWADIPVSQLREFAAKVRRAADAVREAESKYPGPTAADEALDAWGSVYLFPQEKACKFCDAKATCPALRNEVREILGAPASAEDFAQFVPDEVNDQTGDNWLSVAMSKADLVEMWLTAVRAEVERRLCAGQTIDGFKLVEGRQGPRKWRDAAEAEAKLKSLRLKQDEMYDKSLISPTTAEKLLKKDKPKQWEALSKEHITRTNGKPSVAPVTDKRPALAVVATEEDFAELAAAE